MRTLFNKVAAKQHQLEGSEVVGSVHEQVVAFGAVGIVRAGHPASVHVVEDEVPELGDSKQRRVSRGLGSERRGHWGREEFFGKMKENEGNEGKLRSKHGFLGEKNENLERGLGNLGLNSTGFI
ncbi:hypothetical protein TB2_033934 [Malus domestica]